MYYGTLDMSLKSVQRDLEALRRVRPECLIRLLAVVTYESNIYPKNGYRVLEVQYELARRMNCLTEWEELSPTKHEARINEEIWG